MKELVNFDAIIIGGSYAGLSAGMALGRSLRHVLIIDGGTPCNRQTPHSHNFITQDGERPAAIALKAKEQVMQYDTVQFIDDLVVEVSKNEKGFVVTTRSGQVFEAKKLILATGIKDKMPEINGFAECWGITVIHCPYCHGYEFRNKKTGIMANAERAFHLAMLVSNLTDDVTILATFKTEFSEEQLLKLEKHNIEIIAKPVAAIEHMDGHVQSLVFEDGEKRRFDAVYAGIPFELGTSLPLALGCELTETGHIKVDAFQKTTVEGVYACGDNASPMRSVASAVHTGNLTGAMVNAELAKEAF